MVVNRSAPLQRINALGIGRTKTFCKNVPRGCRWDVHFVFPSALMTRDDAKTYVRVYILEEFGVEDVAFWSQRDGSPSTFHAVFFTDWRA